MISVLFKMGFEMTTVDEDAEVVVVNTCCFIHDAKDESISNILSAAELKKTGSCKVLIVTGCMAQMYGQDILDELPEVDAVLGTDCFDRIKEAVDLAFDGKRCLYTKLSDSFPKNMDARVSVTGGHSEYLKIAEGCDKHCTYCIIPSLRGNYRSVPMDELISEAAHLAAEGVTELNLVAQETTLYGKDLYGEKRLHILIKELAAIEGLKWIRILYMYPEEIYPELIETIASEPKICRYFDLPIQHCSDDILKRMGRRTSKADLYSIIANLRAVMPDVTLRTSLITGFPGETKKQHEELLSFIEDIRFDHLGVFTYSREDGTAAALYENQIDEDIKEARRNEIMLLQQRISYEIEKEKIGQTLEVFVEGYLPDDGVYIGRTRGDAPGVDSYIFFESNLDLPTGCIVKCKVTGANEYDLVGELEDESSK